MNKKNERISCMEMSEIECHELSNYLGIAKMHYEKQGLNNEVEKIEKYMNKFRSFYTPISIEEILERR